MLMVCRFDQDCAYNSGSWSSHICYFLGVSCLFVMSVQVSDIVFS